MSYARNVGRVGALAIALGVGIGLGAAPGIASADETASSSGSAGASSADSSSASQSKKSSADRGADDRADDSATAKTPKAESDDDAESESPRRSRTKPTLSSAGRGERADDPTDAAPTDDAEPDDEPVDAPSDDDTAPAPDSDPPAPEPADTVSVPVSDPPAPTPDTATVPTAPAQTTSLWVLLSAAWRQLGRSDIGATPAKPAAPQKPGATAPETPVVPQVPDVPATTPVNAAPVADPAVHTPGWFGSVWGRVNATDPDGDRLVYRVDPAAKGAVSVTSWGRFSYTPTVAARRAAGAAAATAADKTDTFTITVDDGSGNVVAVPVTVTIKPIKTLGSRPPTVPKDRTPADAQNPMPPAEQGEGRIVITIGGLGTRPEDTGDYLRGYAKAEGNTWIPLAYPAAARQSSITEGAANLDRLLRTTAGMIDVIAMSQGAQVVGEWLSTYATLHDAPPADRLRFTLLGNPGRALGANPDRMGWNGLRIALTPENTAYTVRDIAQRWDGWANWENWPSLQRIAEDVVRLFVGMFTDHSGAYDDVDVTTLQVRAVVGNTTYYVAT
ncbi:PE-PPE domain-containing protein [Mycolicibacterium parafortuitum]|uniref:PE-PPE domain-containing protein n=1 Tax=Mycolicibacterium parafortuitum TaxID=39692 RepID=A0A375YGG6_MYCPF|nr:PE-PPE domain-containing protein [Mycolicibacterium parafortuitum]ORB28042.1 hypothetical protein BST38_22095 [Mycolicibacterium parafortuitum]SRX80144.1 hypothetical protein MPP7335_01883 [Mycolicibacterium parafortuitum]